MEMTDDAQHSSASPTRSLDSTSLRDSQSKKLVPAARSSVRQREEHMQREVCEYAGWQARVAGIAREANPYVRPVIYPIVDLQERERLRVLADYWQRGWDSANAGA